MHSTNQDLEKFKNSQMSTDEMIAFLEHLDQCDFCLDQMMTHEKLAPTVSTPDYLKEQILKKAASLEVKAEKSTLETSRKMQLFYESLRTTAGVLMALALLFTVGQIDFSSLYHPAPNISAIHQTDMTAVHTYPVQNEDYLRDFSADIGERLSGSTDKISNYLNQISNKIVNGGK